MSFDLNEHLPNLVIKCSNFKVSSYSQRLFGTHQDCVKCYATKTFCFRLHLQTLISTNFRCPCLDRIWWGHLTFNRQWFNNRIFQYRHFFSENWLASLTSPAGNRMTLFLLTWLKKVGKTAGSIPWKSIPTTFFFPTRNRIIQTTLQLSTWTGTKVTSRNGRNWLSTPEQNDTNVVDPFNAYAKAGEPEVSR